ncbi:MAG: hypothetical protein BZY82_02920 [SAR202 cluster bacterium Io17-Chloro-G3]|nr:MAG: hypothetical protein BZY82_02920 [SAR202 cluster bacterium Io17-Chloro-G3]
MDDLNENTASYCYRCGSSLALKLYQGSKRPVCTRCGTVIFQDPKVVAGVIVEVDGKIVMIRRKLAPGIGKWSFPAGFVDRGERVEDAAIRETEEESGLKVKINGLIGVYSEPDDPNILVVYAGSVIGGSMVPGPEAQEVGTFDTLALPSQAFQRDASILSDWVHWKDNSA